MKPGNEVQDTSTPETAKGRRPKLGCVFVLVFGRLWAKSKCEDDPHESSMLSRDLGALCAAAEDVGKLHARAQF